jgi:hypothetical protein
MNVRNVLLPDYLQIYRRTLVTLLQVCIIVVSIRAVVSEVRERRALHGTLRSSELVMGARVVLPGLTPSLGENTLVLAVSSTCPFCENNVKFYKNLSQQRSKLHVRLVALMPGSCQDAAQYLATRAIGVDQLLCKPLTTLGVYSTPTLFLLNANERVDQLWVGALRQDEQDKVITFLSEVRHP